MTTIKNTLNDNCAGVRKLLDDLTKDEIGGDRTCTLEEMSELFFDLYNDFYRLRNAEDSPSPEYSSLNSMCILLYDISCALNNLCNDIRNSAEICQKDESRYNAKSHRSMTETMIGTRLSELNATCIRRSPVRRQFLSSAPQSKCGAFGDLLDDAESMYAEYSGAAEKDAEICGKKRLPEDEGDGRLCLKCGNLASAAPGALNRCGGRWFGKSGKRADIYVVGEAPGEWETREGSFFVGPSGILLGDWLRNAGLSGKKVYLDNAVRCTPISDLSEMTSAQRGKMIRNCFVYLEENIRKLRPKVIVALGNSALKALINQTGITKWRGRALVHQKFGAWFVPSLHPAAVLRGRDVSGDVCNFDIKLARKLAAKAPNLSFPETVAVDGQETFDECMREMEAADRFVVDLETTALDAEETGAEIIGMALCCNPDRGYFVPFVEWDHERHEITKKSVSARNLNRIRKLLNRDGPVKIFHNAAFDLRWLAVKLDCFPRPIYDTIIANSILADTPANDLKTLAWLRTNYGGYADNLKEYVKNQKTTFLAVPRPVLSDYAALDGTATFALYEYLTNAVSENEDLRELIDVHNELRLNLTEMELNGIRINAAHVKRMLAESISARDRALALLRRVVGNEDLNPDSSPQLLKAFFGNDGIYRRSDFPGIKKPSTDKKALAIIRKKLVKSGRTGSDLETLDALQEYRRAGKLVSTYLQPFLNRTAEGRIRSHFTQHVTSTGRLSGREPNLQNIPRTDDMRNCFCASPGHTLVELDYSQAELRIAAEYSGDSNMLEILNRGGDIHSFVGMNTIMKPDGSQYDMEMFIQDDMLRSQAKIVGFSIIYGKTAVTLAEELGKTVEEAETIIDLLKRRTFPALGRWIDEQEEYVLKYGHAKTLFGRVIPVSGWDSDDRSRVEYAKRCAANYPVQSAASDCVMIGINRVMRALKKRRWKARAVLTVHDSLVLEVADPDVKRVAAGAKAEMERPIRQIGSVKMLADVKCGKRWGSARKLKL